MVWAAGVHCTVLRSSPFFVPASTPLTSSTGCRNRQAYSNRAEGIDVYPQLVAQPQQLKRHQQHVKGAPKAASGLGAASTSWLGACCGPRHLLPVINIPALLSTAALPAAASMAAGGAATTGPVLTARAVAAGLLVGSVLCFSNTYFGLQTGWVTMGSLQVSSRYL